MKCVKCSHPMLPDRTYRATPVGERGGRRAHRGRGLCSRCYKAAQDDGSVIDHEGINRKAEHVYDEALDLVEMRGLRYRDLPAALGMTRDALTTAVRRGVRKGHPQALALSELNTYPTKGVA